MNGKQRIAILVDADNVTSDQIEFAVEGIESEGIVTLRRAFGRLTSIKGHEAMLSRLAFAAEVALPTGNGSKNAADLLLAQFAARIAERRVVEAIALVSSDSDFVSVANAISEAGVHVFGYGREDAPDTLKRAYSSFTPFPENQQNSKGLEIGKGPTAENFREMKKLIDASPNKDAEGRIRVQTLGLSFKQKFGDQYLEHFGTKNLSTLLRSVDGLEVRGEGVTMTVGRKRTTAN